MTKKKDNELFIPCWVICSDKRIFTDAWISTASIENSKSQLKMIISDKYQLNGKEILAVNNALVQIGIPDKICVN